MQSRKNHDKASRTSKEGDIQVAEIALITSQSVSFAEKAKQTSSKSTSKSLKASPRRKVQSRADDLKYVQSTFHRHQSPSPSRGSSQASSSPIFAHACEAHSASAKSEDGSSSTAPGVMSSPINTPPSHGRAHLPHVRKLSGRSRHSDLPGKSKVTIRLKEDGKVYIRRCSEDRNLDPDRLVIDRCNLKVFPIIEAEEQLRLLNLQHNQISIIENLHLLTNLVFLDLSDNTVEHISGLDFLHFLRVLILARNRIKNMQGLDSLVHLDVLDLSSNEIKEITNLSHMRELRVLNLSCNQLSEICNIKKLDSLIELNLSKNSLSTMAELDSLSQLQRLFLAQNFIERLEDINCIMGIKSLSELNLDGCPVALRPHYRYLMMIRIPQLKFLDMRRILDEEKRTAQSVLRREESKRQEMLRIAKIKETREKAITTAHHLWESSCKDSKSSMIQYEQLPMNPSPPYSAVPIQLLAARSIPSFSEEEDDPLCSCCGGQGDNCDQCDSGKPIFITRMKPKVEKAKSRTQKKNRDSSRLRKMKHAASLELEVSDARLTFLAVLEDGHLQLYGPGAVAAAINNPWSSQTFSIVHTACFHFIVFDSISHLLGKVKSQFPNIIAAIFECTCLNSLSQLNSLGQISGLQTLTICTDGNLLLKLTLWRMYAVYRLGPSIANINDITVTQLERVKSEDIFGGLGLAVSSLLPKYRLSSLLNSPRVKQMFLKEKGYSPNSLQRPPDSQLASDVIKVAFTYNPDFECMQPTYKTYAKKIVKKNLIHTSEARRKRLVFQRLWPSMYLEIVNDALEDYTDLNRHMKLSMLSLLKKCKTLHEDDNYD